MGFFFFLFFFAMTQTLLGESCRKSSIESPGVNLAGRKGGLCPDPWAEKLLIKATTGRKNAQVCFQLHPAPPEIQIHPILPLTTKGNPALTRNEISAFPKAFLSTGDHFLLAFIAHNQPPAHPSAFHGSSSIFLPIICTSKGRKYLSNC